MGRESGFQADHLVDNCIMDLWPALSWIAIAAGSRGCPHSTCPLPVQRLPCQRFTEGAFDLVLMDVEMPEMDGIAATQAIRAAEREGARVPIVAVTATGDPESCLRAGMDDWMPKPLSISRLNQTLE